MRSRHSSERIEEMVCELEGYRWDAISMGETRRPDRSEIWETRHRTHIHGCRKIRKRKRSWNYAEQEVEAKNYRYRIHQRTGHHHHNRGQPPTHQTDECALLPLGVCGPSHRENVQNDREAHSKLQKKTYPLLEETSMQKWDLVTELKVQVLAGTHSTRETKEVTV